VRPWLLIYLLCGMCWQAYNFYGGPLSEGIREEQVKIWAKGGIWRVLQTLSFIFGVVAWPITALLIPLVLVTFFKGTTDRLQRWMRRAYIDRPGLLEPQMPAARCTQCDSAMDRLSIPCAKCKVHWDLDHCEKCCDKKKCAYRVHDGWTCPPCSPIPVPVCQEHQVPFVYVHEPCSTCGKPAQRPLCAKCKEEGLYTSGVRCFRCVMTVMPPFVHSEVFPRAIACLDCVVSLDAKSLPISDGQPLPAESIRAFEHAHAEHRMQAVLMDGTSVKIVGPGWRKEKGSEP